MNSTEDKVDSPSIQYSEMAARWGLITDLLGGTRAMREAGKRWLPQEPRETDVSYDNRLRRSFLFGAFADAVDRVVAKPFSVPVTLKGNYPEFFNEMLRDVDNCGNDITLFARCVFTDGVAFGLSHILVDYPQTGGELNAKEERDLNLRPYFVHVKAKDLIGWKTRADASGRKVIAQVRIKENAVVPVGNWGEKVVERIRVFGEESFQTFEKSEKTSEFVGGAEIPHSFGKVPLTTFATDDDGFMAAKPPLEDVAWLNLAHWQSQSDQRNILRFARFGLMFASGFTEEEIARGFAIGPTSMISSVNPEAKMSIIEHSGRALSSGQEDLEQLERKMDSLGLRPFVDQKGNPTATGKAMDEAKSFSSILAWIRSLEASLRSAFVLAAEWKGETVGESFDVQVFSDFGIAVQTYEAIQNLTAARVAREISRQTYLEEIKRRGLISDTVVIEDEIDRIESEPPPPGATGFGNEEQDGGGGSRNGAGASEDDGEDQKAGDDEDEA